MSRRSSPPLDFFSTSSRSRRSSGFGSAVDLARLRAFGQARAKREIAKLDGARGTERCACAPLDPGPGVGDPKAAEGGEYDAYGSEAGAAQYVASFFPPFVALSERRCAANIQGSRHA